MGESSSAFSLLLVLVFVVLARLAMNGPTRNFPPLRLVPFSAGMMAVKDLVLIELLMARTAQRRSIPYTLKLQTICK